jgi:hypothetical protein
MENEIQRESLKDQMSRVEQETRMVLPGIQALFGFQLVAVFNNRFGEALNSRHQLMHWLALAFTAVATMLTMAPAAYHRQAEPDIISAKLVHHANCWLTLSLVPLMLGICIDFYLIGIVITEDEFWSALAGALLLSGFVLMWFVIPLLAKRHSYKV